MSVEEEQIGCEEGGALWPAGAPAALGLLFLLLRDSLAWNVPLSPEY